MAAYRYIDRYGARKELAPGDRITHGDGRTFTVKALAENGCLVKGGVVCYANIWKINGHEIRATWR